MPCCASGRGRVRVRVYRRFVETGGAPRLEELARELDESVTTIRACPRELAAARHVVLDEHDAIVMAHPFSAIPLGFSVMSATTLWWGGCAWDS
ncbi:MAG TPA: alkylmercury lyase, partial [Propionibacteriaceae bacterium]